MSNNLAQAITLVFGSEGGFSNHPKDPGGATKYGITAATLGASRRLGRKATPEEVKAMPLAEASKILSQQYAEPLRYLDLPAGLDYALFDFAVNSGPAQAVKTLQRILNAQGGADGILGAKTLDAIRRRDTVELISALQVARLKFLRGLRTWSTFGRGWSDRVDHVRRNALRMAGGISAGAPAPETGRETANPADTKISATTEGKGTIAATIGAAGAAIGAAKDALQPLVGNGAFVDTVFTVLVMGGSLVTVAGIAVIGYRQLKNRAVLA